MSSTTVVVGASRGIGLELVRQLQTNALSDVVATMRKPFLIDEGNVKVIKLDQNDNSSVEEAAKKIPVVDTLIVNAAMGEEELLKDITSDRLTQYLDTNVVGVHRVIRAFLPSLYAGKGRRIVYISSTAASLTQEVDATFGLHGPYALSKAAGNMLTVQFHNELHRDGFTVVAIHPGWVATEMGNTVGEGGMPVEESVSAVLRIVEKLEWEDSAKFYKFDGTILPW